MTNVRRNVLAVAVGVTMGAAGGSALASSKKTSVDKGKNSSINSKKTDYSDSVTVPGSDKKLAGKRVTFVKPELTDLFKSHKPDAQIDSIENISQKGHEGPKHYDVTENLLRVVVGPTVSLHRYAIPAGALNDKAHARVSDKSNYTVYSDKGEKGEVTYTNTKFGKIPSIIMDTKFLNLVFELGGFTVSYDNKGQPFVVELFDSSGVLKVPGKYEHPNSHKDIPAWDDKISG